MIESTVSVDDLISELKRAGLRVTEARRAVCQVLVETPDAHLTPVDILERAREASGRPIDPSTVYRTLDAFAGAGLVRHVHLGHGPGVYHLAASPEHHHLVCEVCGRVVDVPMSEFSSLIQHLEEEYGFVADGLHFALSGRCVEHR